jgi:hypothetical protein
MEGTTRRKVAVESNPVTLINGATIEGRVAQATMMHLRTILNSHASGQALIEDLHLLAEGRPDEARHASRLFFAGEKLLMSRQTGELLPEVRDLILSAFRRVPDGVVLVEPYQPTEANRAALTAVDAEFQAFFRRHFGPEPGAAEGRGEY